MARYRLVATRTVTGDYLTDLDWSSLQFSEVLNGAGQLQAPLRLDRRLSAAQLAARVSATAAWTTSLWVLRVGDPNPIWGGPVVQRPIRLSDDGYTVTANDWWDYLARVDLGTFRATGDAMTLAHDIIAQGLAKPGVPSYLRVPAVAPCGHTTTVDYANADDPYVAEVIGELSQQDTPLGFDFTVQPENVAGTFGCAFPLWWPERDPVGEVLFSWPGNIADMDWPEDGSQQATDYKVLGAGSGPTQLRATAVSAQRGVTLPRLHRTDQRTTQTQQTIVSSLAAGGIKVAEAPVIVPTIDVGPGQEPLPGTFHVGQTARVRVVGHPAFPYGLDARARITTIVTDVTSEGVATSKVTLAQPVPV